MNKTCKFCSVFDLAEAPCDRPVLRTPNFIVAPTVGALVPGWMLIVSREHHISAGSLPTPLFAELRETIDRVFSAMTQIDTTPAVFEHGPACENTSVGCGIDHCHMHVVPVDFDLYAEAEPLSQECQIVWAATRDLRATKQCHDAGQPYLYVEQGGIARIGTSRHLPSQFFRRVIAARQGRPQEFDWKRHNVASPAHLLKARRLNLVLSEGPR